MLDPCSGWWVTTPLWNVGWGPGPVCFLSFVTFAVLQSQLIPSGSSNMLNSACHPAITSRAMKQLQLLLGRGKNSEQSYRRLLKMIPCWPRRGTEAEVWLKTEIELRIRLRIENILVADCSPCRSLYSFPAEILPEVTCTHYPMSSPCDSW